MPGPSSQSHVQPTKNSGSVTMPAVTDKQPHQPQQPQPSTYTRKPMEFKGTDPRLEEIKAQREVSSASKSSHFHFVLRIFFIFSIGIVYLNARM